VSKDAEINLEDLHDWFDGVVRSALNVFGPSAKDVIRVAETMVGHRCTWIVKSRELRSAMRDAYGLVGEVLVTMLFEEAVKQAYMLRDDQRQIVLGLLGARSGSWQAGDRVGRTK
jgi:hypothetical protein